MAQDQAPPKRANKVKSVQSSVECTGRPWLGLTGMAPPSNQAPINATALGYTTSMALDNQGNVYYY